LDGSDKQSKVAETKGYYFRNDDEDGNPVGSVGNRKERPRTDFKEVQEEAIPCHSRKGIKRESNTTHARGLGMQ
jgi:hypothetical protein